MNAATNGNNIKKPADLMAIIERVRSNPRVIFLIAAAAALSIIIALLFWAKAPDYRVLFSNINDRDGGDIVAQLTQMNVPYRFDERQGAILVPEEQVYDLRLKLAQQGLPKGGTVGFELLDQEKFGISEFSEQVNFQRALEGELSRTIDTLGPVKSSRVHLATPKESLFIQDQKAPSASVTLELAGGRSLDEGQVSAITHLISSAVPGLTADNVTIVDQSGRLLTQGGEQATRTSQLRYTNKIEEDYQHRIQAILAPIVGSNNVRAQVTAKIDFSVNEQTAEQYQPNSAPDKKAVRSRQASGSEQGGKDAVGGVPGALSNQPPVPTSAPIDQTTSAPSATGNGGKLVPWNSHNDETVNYELDRTLTHIRRSPGGIEQLSAAVVVNYAVDKTGTPVALSKAQMDQINALVKEAMGFSSQRGDSLSVVNSPFSAPDEENTIPLWKQPETIHLLLEVGRYLLIALVAWILWRKAVQPFWIKHQELALQRLELEKEARQAELDAQIRKKESIEKSKAQQRVDTEITTQHLRSIAEQEPHVLAAVVRKWLMKGQK
ncbi:flagellar M-ring protein FliF [Enterobacter sp. BIGb0383]|uniref:flagellar basal-body MS-ring/collar protein FliF n=1 Tax=unclassified Enterobacter TaxID=2608935 RepID=UPI000F46633C|nr:MULTISPECIES: flagellar basal-body MS-ring/collar protein FliF [unclassified Enterobacter]ROP58328.1 flagellar M-ring protein FliF [Enterobacter sp. BIGb0383]ROS06784.1 flagellar M-ring protein FliF [Enterobacter sp. BIGb0359]